MSDPASHLVSHLGDDDPTARVADGNLRERELGRLLDGALDRDPDSWQAYLESASDDPSVIREAAALLGEEEDLLSVLAQPAAHILDLGPTASLTGAASDEDLHHPSQIGPYSLLYCLGEGGMGRVYLAEQTEPVERRVALKLALRVQTHPEARRRFLLERKALGRLTHPNIARLYEAGTTTEGRPFVAMELVEGPKITDYCDQHSLSIEARLRLFLEVCLGAQHAHQKQILHRDLKPSNILVDEIDGKPVAKVIDFGIAKALDQPFDHTFATGDRLLGTPHYMSPEALQPSSSDDLDTRTDVYSLGVVLYELITGVRPFSTPATDLARLLREILDDDPKRPSTRILDLDSATRYRLAAARLCDPESHASALSGDLDWIVTKAMAKDRDRRYGSAAELGDELQRVLEHLPILARPPSRLYRFNKLMRRQRLTVTLAALTAAGLILATVLTSFALWHARQAGEQSRRDAEVSKRTLDFVLDLFEAAGPEGSSGEQATARDLLAEGIQRLRESDLPPLARGQILHTLGDVHGRLGLYPQARELLSESLDIREQELHVDADEVLSSAELLGNLERRAGHLEAAESLLERVLATVEDKPADPLALAKVLNSVANLRWSQHRLAEAETLHRRALALRQEHLQPMAEDTATSHNNLGALLFSATRYDEAEPHLRRAVEAFESRLGPRHSKVADAVGNLALILQRLGHYSESEMLHRRALEIRHSVFGRDHPLSATALHNLAVSTVGLGRFEEAEASYREALQVRRRALGDQHGETLQTLSNLGLLLWRMKRYEEAETLLQQAVEIRRRQSPPDDRGLNRSRLNLALVWRDQGQTERARTEMQAVLASQRGNGGSPGHGTALTLHHLAVLAVLESRDGDAEALFLQALDIRRAASSPATKFLADTLFELGELCRRQGRAKEAEQHHREAFKLRQKILPGGHPDRVRSEISVSRG